MDFEQAKAAHFDWKAKLKTYMKTPDGSLKHSIVAQDNQCILGKWIYGEGKKYDHLPEYQELIKHHAEFHKCAAEVIKKADSGLSVTEEIAFGMKSPYNSASAAVTAAIIKIQKIAESEAA